MTVLTQRSTACKRPIALQAIRRSLTGERHRLLRPNGSTRPIRGGPAWWVLAVDRRCLGPLAPLQMAVKHAVPVRNVAPRDSDWRPLLKLTLLCG